MSPLTLLTILPFVLPITGSIILGLSAIVAILILFNDRKPYHYLVKRWNRMFHHNRIKYLSRWSDDYSVDVHNNVLYISRFNKSVHDRREYLYSIAHEFGHLISEAIEDYYLGTEDEDDNKQDNVQAIYNEEIRAWRIARVLLKEANQFDEKHFNKVMNKNLKQYRIQLKIPIKKRARRFKNENRLNDPKKDTN